MTGEHCRVLKYPDANILTVETLDAQLAGNYLGHKLLAVVAFQWIGEEKIIRHDAIQRFRVTPHQRLDPLIVHLSQLLFDFNVIRIGLHGSFHGTLPEDKTETF